MPIRSATFVFTPEVVGTWMLYPIWLCMPGLFPRRLVLDNSDVGRSEREARSFNATPYDVITWETMRTHINNDFLICNYPQYGTRHEHPMLYDKIAGRHLNDFREIAQSIVRSLSKEQLLLIVKHGYENWKKFGLELKSHLKGNDPVFIEAIEQTDNGIADILQGNLPIDPARLVQRYLMKLQVGLQVRKKYAEWYNEPENTICVFDTPEYGPAAKLLAKKLNLDPAIFAIPTCGPDKNEQLIREVLSLEESTSPICGKDLTLLYEAIDYIKELQSNSSDDQIKKYIADQVELAKREVKRYVRIEGLSLTGGNLPILHEAAQAVGGCPT